MFLWHTRKQTKILQVHTFETEVIANFVLCVVKFWQTFALINFSFAMANRFKKISPNLHSADMHNFVLCQPRFHKMWSNNWDNYWDDNWDNCYPLKIYDTQFCFGQITQ